MTVPGKQRQHPMVVNPVGWIVWPHPEWTTATKVCVLVSLVSVAPGVMIDVDLCFPVFYALESVLRH